MTSLTTKKLKTILFLGSTRNASPPWGGAKRLGDRVLKYIKAKVDEFNSDRNDVNFDIEVWDPVEMDCFKTVMGNPTYFNKPDDVSEDLKTCIEKVAAADCYLVVTPEYNHSIPHGLTNMMNQFGGSKYAWKPSGCVCYSGTPIGGSRVAQALRPYLSELGCLPISKQLVIQSAGNVFNEDGTFTNGENEFMTKQTKSFLAQLAWWAEACQEQRKKGTP